MSVSSYSDFDHLMRHAELLFPGAALKVIHTDDEVIHIAVDGHCYTFEIGSDDSEYVFTDGETTFTIPLMENPEDF